MNSREKILEAVLQNQPETTALPDLSEFRGDQNGVVQKYVDVFKSIGGDVFVITDLQEIYAYLTPHYTPPNRVVTTIPELGTGIEMVSSIVDPHTYEDVELAILQSNLAVAENGAVWLTEQCMGQRILPYICQHLAVVVYAENILPTLHEAYEIIGEGNYGFAGFIGGPSKTADIEQALVLGAHGPLSMTVFVLERPGM